MPKEFVSKILLIILWIGLLTLTFNIRTIEGICTGPVYINANKSIHLLADGTQTTIPVQLSISPSHFTISSGK